MQGINKNFINFLVKQQRIFKNLHEAGVLSLMDYGAQLSQGTFEKYIAKCTESNFSRKNGEYDVHAAIIDEVEFICLVDSGRPKDE